jgi:hypothetical protein
MNRNGGMELTTAYKSRSASSADRILRPRAVGPCGIGEAAALKCRL